LEFRKAPSRAESSEPAALSRRRCSKPRHIERPHRRRPRRHCAPRDLQPLPIADQRRCGPRCRT
jgi:hypothetical protein